MAPTSPGTEDHPPIAADPSARGREALIVASPRSSALALPPMREAVGRDWFDANGAPDRRISSKHLVFTRPGGQLHLEDAGSRNGTWVNGARLRAGERVPLSDGAIVRAGSTLLVLRSGLVGPLAAAAPLGAMVGPFGLRRVAATFGALARHPPPNVLIEGETGSGKELAAAALHALLRPGRPYAPINLAGVAAGVFESQLFGHTAGAFSGASRDARGVLVAHDGGTVFLDELGELPLELQPKLLRLLENREVFAVGAERPRRVDVLLIGATNRELDAMVEAGTFRRDLLARFGGARVELPPLRERPEDLPALLAATLARKGVTFEPAHAEIEALERLMLHDWRSNARELSAVVERVAALDPPPSLRAWAVERVLGPAPSSRAGQLVREQVEAALAASGGNETEAARRLGVTRGKLRRFLSGGQ